MGGGKKRKSPLNDSIGEENKDASKEKLAQENELVATKTNANNGQVSSKYDSTSATNEEPAVGSMNNQVKEPDLERENKVETLNNFPPDSKSKNKNQSQESQLPAKAIKIDEDISTGLSKQSLEDAENSNASACAIVKMEEPKERNCTQTEERNPVLTMDVSQTDSAANNPKTEAISKNNSFQGSPKTRATETSSSSNSKQSNTKTKENTKEEDSSMSTTVYVAAPLQKNHILAVTGTNSLLGGWKQPKGSFERVVQISGDIFVFRGVIPVPTSPGSPFKFVQVNMEDNKILYEGDNSSDNRTDELLPGSTNFFLFKPKSKSFLEKVKSGFSNNSPKPETKQKVAVEFFNIMIDHIIGSLFPDWDAAFEFIGDSLGHIQREIGSYTSDGFRQFLNEQFKNSEQELDCDKLLLLVIAACKIGVYSKCMKDFIQKNSKVFCQYLYHFKSFKRNIPEFATVLENFTQHAGSDFWWILFRINRHEAKSRTFGCQKFSESTLKTLQEIPEVLLSDKLVATRVVDYLVRWNNIDDLYCNMRPIFAVNANYQQMLDSLLLQKLLVHKTNTSDFAQILRSDFLKKAYQNSRPNNLNDSNQLALNSGNLFDDSIRTIFNQKLSDVIRLAVHVPDYLLPAVIPVVEHFVTEKIHPTTNFSREDYRYFSQLDPDQLNDFPQTKKQIEEKLMKMTREHLKTGSFQSIPSLRLILLVLAERNDVPFLDRPKVVDLQKSINRLPRKFFQNLHSVVKPTPGVSVEKTLRVYRKGKTKEIVERLENHFDQLDEILEKVQSRSIPLIELTSLNDPQVLDCLKNIGLTDDQQAEFRRDVEGLKRRHQLYGTIYGRYARLSSPIDGPVVDLELEEDGEVHADDEENEGDQRVDILDTIQVLEPKEWEGYLKDIDVERSILTLQNALALPVPLESKAADWLVQIKNCTLFMDKVWFPQVESSKICPLFKDDLVTFIDECAYRWERLALRVAGGDVSFREMDEIIRLQPDHNVLSRSHLKCKPVDQVRTAYYNFRNIQDLRYLIRPFVAALRFFSIRDREPIDKLYNFVENNLLKHWEKTKLSQVVDTGMIQMLNVELNIDPERPETKDAMQFISSLVTDDNRSPLIEWLREKTEQDMEAMGKILQSTLLEAYGQLQTLKTRIAPFLQKEFNAFQDLLRVVRLSEERFAQRISGRVQPIKCKWLVNMLPEIEAAIRASVISPSEDAKEKLAKLRQVVIDPKSDTFSMEVRLEPTGSLSMDELKQAFQLLDMAVVDDGRDGGAGELVGRTRKHVGLIERLSEVFGLLFASGCITYTFRERIVIELNELEEEIERMQEQLVNWNSKWKEIDEMRLLSLFSRGYLLQLADLIGRNKIDEALSILKFLLPSSPQKLEGLVKRLALNTPRIGDDDDSWLSTAQLFNILRQLYEAIEVVFHQQGPQVVLPPFLVSYGRTLKSHFIDKAVVILNVPRELLVGSALAAYISVTGRPIEPSRILFVTANTDKQELERFMALWSVAEPKDFFIIVHIERLTAAGATAVREGVDRVVPERRAKLFLLAQHHHRIQSTKSLGARLGLVSDRLLETNFTADQLRQFFSTLLSSAANLHFFTSKLPGCGKSQQAMRQASEERARPDYYRIPVRIGSVEELLASLKSVENLSSHSRKRAAFLHLDVAHSVSLEFNDILLSLLIHGALYDPKKAKLGFWMISPETSIAIEFASPFGTNEFPIIGYLGKHHLCECNAMTFSYDLVTMANIPGQPVIVNRSNPLIAAGKFLQLKQAGVEGLSQWNDLCSFPETIMLDPLPEEETFRLLVDAFHHEENRKCPTFSALNAMATFLHRHICAMVNSMWFNASAVYLFEQEGLARVFKLNVFNLLLKVANDSITRCWSMANKGMKLTEMDWINRQRAMFLLGLDEEGCVTGMNVVGRDAAALKNMFHASLLPILQQQCLQFQEFRGFKNLMETPEGAEVVINAMRSLLLLDGTATSAVKVYQLDSHPRGVPANLRLQELTGQDRGYVLTGDNITKMMFALYRIRCGLPVVAFGEAGVGKSALFRFLIETLLGHTFQVCNVNSGTSIHDVEEMIESAMGVIANSPDAQVFLFFDEMNTADPPVIAFFKELMLDRHCHGTILPNNLHLMAAANPYRCLSKVDKEATVGLAFRFAQSAHGVDGAQQTDGRNLVYRVNELPLAFYDHIYDFGHLCLEAEHTYIDEICQHGLSKDRFHPDTIRWFASVIRTSHQMARALSVDPDSAVSLRDATRAVQLFHWFCHAPAGVKMAGDAAIAADLTIYLVYAFRFRDRKLFLKNVFGQRQTASQNMTEVSRKIAKMLYKEAHGASIGSGAIALNDALCENLFALYVCVLNGIFLIIVGRPGSSKSLSVEILKLVLSPGNHTLRNNLGDLPAITELYFQCSPLSTSSGFKALFESAQRLSVDPKTMLAMVVLDELGLADMSPEKPIKVLHSELERKSVLTSGEEQQSPYSVVALSNWVVDAAQVNRGILITRIQANKKDLLESATQLADSLVEKHVKESEVSWIKHVLKNGLESIVSTYQTLDEQKEIGGGHFFSMRDFFFCVKNFVCSVFDSTVGVDARLSQHSLVHSAIRNFGGHEKALRLARRSMADNLEIDEGAMPEISPLELIIQNIQDSSKPLSIHIARHLMILNRSLIGLQLLNRHVKSQLDDGTNWNVLFGSCFPGDLQVTAVTRKLRQVEQAIRTGGVLILCHADQLFESLYMVLNQQYWAQGEVTMTQIALGPSIRAIALPNGPFRIIALQDTDVALNRGLMSPAILSRFEKHELRPSHLLDNSGRHWLNLIKTHPVWLDVPETVKRQKLLIGYHEESFSSLALQLQDRGIPMEMDEVEEIDRNGAHAVWMRAANPMAMIKLERDSRNNPELLEVCRRYRHCFVLQGMEDALNTVRSNRMVLMTNTLRHLEIAPEASSTYRYFVIQLFDVQTELELYRLMESIKPEDLDDPTFCLVVQYDAVTGPIEQFQLTKYEVEQRFEKTECRIIFVVHVDPRPVNMHWVFSFGDGWDYCFVDEVVPGGPADQHHIPLSKLVLSPSDHFLSQFIREMSLESFKSLLLEMLGPVLQTSLASLRSSLGQFFSGVRTALGMSVNQDLIKLLQECLLAQLDESRVTWNVVDAVNDANFDSSSSLTEGLWGVFKHKISNPLAHLLLVSDVWRVFDKSSAKLWCDFVAANYPNRLMSLHSPDSIVQIPVGFRSCTRPFGRLLASFDINFANQSDSRLNGPLQWLLDRVAKNEDDDAQEMKEAYFMDWFLLRIPPHLHLCMREIPLSKMSYLVDSLFEEPSMFFLEWDHCEAEVIAALELVSIATFAKSNAKDDHHSLWNGITGRMRNWKFFTESAARLSLTTLGSPEVLTNHNKLMQSVSSIEVSPALTGLLDRVEELPQLWLALRITKRILLFDPKSNIKLPELQVSTPQRLFESLTDLVINSVVRPRVTASIRGRRTVRQADLIAILKSTSSCNSTEELARILGQCPTTNSIVLLEDNVATVDAVGRCSSCNQPLITTADEEDDQVQVLPLQHLTAPKAKDIESLFQDHQKFMFFFERVAELFIQQHKNNPNDIREFLLYLLGADSRLRVSWRFLTVIVRSVLSTRSGTNVIDGLLLTIRCNRLTSEKTNAYNLMRALLASADQDARQNWDAEAETLSPDLVQAAMTGEWTLERIRQLALIRHRLTTNEPEATADAIAQWAFWKQNQNDAAVTESLLFFILRFSSTEGDQTRLSNLFRNQRIADVLNQHPVIGDYIRTLSPFSLGFNLQSANKRTIPFQDRLLRGTAINDGIYEHYPQLLAMQPDWGPFIARLAYHAADVFETHNIRLLARMSNSLVDTAQYLLPGIDNHPYLASFTLEAVRWFLCNCGTLNCVGDCGKPTPASICVGCRQALSQASHVARAGVRRATIQDFAPPTGIHVTRIPSQVPTFTARNASPIVTRFSLLLNSLALMNAALNPQTERHAFHHLLLSLPLNERQQNEDRDSLIQLLSNHIIVHLDLLCQLLLATRPQLAMTDKFRIGHLLLHKLSASQDRSLMAHAADFTAGPQAREAFENGLAGLLAQQVNLVTELDNIAGQGDAATKNFRQVMSNNQTSHWAYTPLVFADRQTVLLELARNSQLRQQLPFLNFVLDEENWTRKLDALQSLGEAIRFVALVRTVLQGVVTQEEANRMTIRQGLDKITDAVIQKAVILDRGRPVATCDQVANLFDGFKKLWDRFSQLQNSEKKTFLDYFECQQVDINVRPKTVLETSAPLILILAGSELPETIFSCQLLSHAIEAASSIALTQFIQPHCRAGSGRVRLNCSSAAALTDFDESLYAHVSTEEVDRFIRDHVIDGTTLQLAESFAMAAVLGPAGSTIAEDLALDVIPEFVFKDDVESNNYLVVLERRSALWQPSPIPSHLQELILADLEKNRSLSEAKSVLMSAITYLQSTTEPLVINKARNNYISDVLEGLLRAEILTERHMSIATLSVFNRHMRLEVRHVFGLLKAIMSRMQGNDIFGGRIPDGWRTMIPERLAQLTRQKLRSGTQSGDITETLLAIVNVVSTSQPVPVELSPSKSLLFAIRQIEGTDWNGIPVELKMEHLGHLLLIVESLSKT